MKKEDTAYYQDKNIVLKKCSIAFFVLEFFLIGMLTVGTIFISYYEMKEKADIAYQNTSTQVSQKIHESMKLLKSLASLSEYYEPEIAWEEKVQKLDKINESYHYMFICYVDQEMQVYTLGEEPASLASREHMQKVYSTKKPLVTDSFVAGADGKTLNYTVVVPLIKDGEITGSLFSTIYFDDVTELIQDAVSLHDADAVLIGSKGQLMSSTSDLPYGAEFTELFEDVKLFFVTEDRLETKLLARKAGGFLGMESGNLFYIKYGPIQGTNWDILLRVDFLSLFSSMFSNLLGALVIVSLGLLGLYFYIRKIILKQAGFIGRIMYTVRKMEKEMYPNEGYHINYEEIFQITGKGLKDDLTGTATRVFFLKHAEQLLKEQIEGFLALCFVDMDNLKQLNDTYGHLAGDIALRNIGNVLREYEKKFDGIVGRYGGDEFILILKDIDDMEELNHVLQELMDRLKMTIVLDDTSIDIHCSIGASVRMKNETLTKLISNADKALYDIKQHDKGSYSIYIDREV